MRAVVVTEPGKVEFSFMWALLFIAQNPDLKKELDKVLGAEFVGKPMTEEMLDNMHERVLDIICAKFKVRGLRDYLDAMKYVEGPEDAG